MKFPEEDRFIKEIERIFDEILEVYTLANEQKSEFTAKNWTPVNLVRRLVYELGQYCEENDLSKKLRKKVKKIIRKENKHGRLVSTDNSSPTKKVFHLIYRGIFHKNELISPSERTRSVKALVFAHEQEVPKEFLIGFVLQSTNSRGDLSSKFIKPASDMKKWANKTKLKKTKSLRKANRLIKSVIEIEEAEANDERW